MVCLNGVETLVNNRCSDLAAVVMFRAGGRPLHSRMCSEDPEVSALSVLLCSVLPPPCVLCPHLCAPSQTHEPIMSIHRVKGTCVEVGTHNVQLHFDH